MGDLAQQIKDITSRCRICKQDFVIEFYDSPRIYCPDCEKTLNEMITWWNNTNRKDNAKKDRE